MNTFRKVLSWVGDVVWGSFTFTLVTIGYLLVLFGLTTIFFLFYSPTIGAAAVCLIIGGIMMTTGVLLIDVLQGYVATLSNEASLTLALILLTTLHYLNGSWVWFSAAAVLTLMAVWDMFVTIGRTAQPAKPTSA